MGILELLFKPKKTSCVVDYNKRFKIKMYHQNSVAVTCEICGITHWAKSLNSLKESIKNSNCQVEKGRLD